MAYQALYRTYRPRDFDEVAGQEHITKTFKNALINNKLAHAYLFSGPRGTGKTSVAKIIAKAVNCEHAPVANPCNVCDTCVGIDRNIINDVIEIDAASNNGVDEIREIRDKVKYLPGTGKYKVYIVDEVHMLSTGAFNALLKTLEEPPKHVIFILATTEPHKIPATIHSRCQRFDFRGIGMEDMLNKLRYIIKKESIAIEEDALHLIAESAEGGLRDSISLLDQVVSYSEDKITLEHVHAIRGSISHEDILMIADAIEHQEVVSALDVLDRLIAEGKESHKLLDDIIRFYRDVLMAKNIALDDELKVLYKQDQFKAYIELVSNARIFYYIDILHDTQQKMRYAGNSKLYLELAFVKMVDAELKKEAFTREKIEAIETTLDKLTSDYDLLFKRTEGMKEAPVMKDGSEEISSADESSESDSKPLFDQDESDTESPDDKPIPKTDKEKPKKPKDKFEEIYARFSKKAYKTFDIHYVEDVLNTGDREIKIDMVKKWFDIERFVDNEHMNYAKMITTGTLVATNGTMMIVTYDTFPMCNRVMSPEIKPRLLEILEKYFERKLMLLALPEEIWETISREFIKKFKSKDDGDDFIKLTPIDHPKLVEIPKEDEENFDDVESESVKEAKDLFGDIVKVKKGD